MRKRSEYCLECCCASYRTKRKVDNPKKQRARQSSSTGCAFRVLAEKVPETKLWRAVAEHQHNHVANRRPPREADLPEDVADEVLMLSRENVPRAKILRRVAEKWPDVSISATQLKRFLARSRPVRQRETFTHKTLTALIFSHALPLPVSYGRRLQAGNAPRAGPRALSQSAKVCLG